MINWKVRIKNRLWVTSFIAQVFILVEFLLLGAHSIGLTDFQLTEELENWVIGVVNAVFMLLSTLGLIQDPTTRGLSDSEQASKYDAPK
ncbi:phage holin [Bacillus massilinigeriensis]|uniref:phage holin n=1 Tax=Bacillus massilionigeriensis TaxID=1805475 RepID=UPI00096B56C0|nr:phage holin [Bacillus massilionigeriensis]